MKYYRLVKNFNHYGRFFKDEIYRQDFVTDGGTPLLDMITQYPSDWEEIEMFKNGVFKFGR